MRILKTKFLLVALVLLGSTACNEDFLEKTPLDRGSVEGFFETEEDVNRAVAGIYDVFQGSVWGGAFYFLQPHFDAVTDNALACCAWEGEYATIARGVHNSQTGGVVINKWQFGYEGIFRANSVLENIDRVEGIPAETVNTLKAEARFLRALIYSDLITLFGDVPLVTKVLTREEGLSVTRSPKEDVLALIVEDLDFAIANLTLQPVQGQLGRPTRQAALAQKARIMLYNERWSEAAATAQQVIEISEANPDIVGLVDDYASVFSPDNENTKEVIFDIQYTEGTQGEGNFLQVFYAPGPEGNPGNGWGSLTPLEGLINSFYTTDGLPIDESPLYDPENPHLNRDPRMEANLFIPGVSEWKGGTYDESLGGFSQTGYAVKKWVDDDAIIGQDGCSCNETNLILHRYADILLTFAEATNEISGPTAEVYDAVNQVRARVGMPPFPEGLSQDEMREEIRHERHVEFPWEGIRYYDLLRWRTAEKVIPGVEIEERVFDPAKHYLWPIPQSEIDLNPDLVQNPGY